MLQEPATFGEPGDPAAIAEACGLAPADIDAAQVVSTGTAHLICVLHDRAALARVAAGPATALSAAVDPGDATCLFLAAPTADPGRWQARSFFLGTDGVREDPATGSAAGPCARTSHTSVASAP